MILFDFSNFPFRKDGKSYKYPTAKIMGTSGKPIENKCDSDDIRFYHHLRSGIHKIHEVYDLS